MKKTEINIAGLFLNTGIILLLIGIVFGCLAGMSYLSPGFLKNQMGFIAMRPMHVSAALFWILMGATAGVYMGLQTLFPNQLNRKLAYTQWILWMVAFVGIFFSYINGQFGGREYWEFSPIWSLPIALAWLVFIVQFIQLAKKFSPWPVYNWMWLTGILFFFFTFLEGYLWLFPYFRKDLITDMTIQWKVNGSMVGSWNQIIYGTSFFMMDRISGNSKVGYSKLAFAMYFLGFFNLCFNWGHHIYTLPTASYIRYIGYSVSMTEWIIFIKILYNWRSEVKDVNQFYGYFPYRFLMAANFWVFINLGQALLMSIPALNLYTHGTHVTVAHAMGTTIGINSMIILAMAFMLYGKTNSNFINSNIWLNRYFWILQIGLFILWLSLNIAGIYKGLWQLHPGKVLFGEMMENLKPIFSAFYIGGLLITAAFIGLSFHLLKVGLNKNNQL